MNPSIRTQEVLGSNCGRLRANLKFEPERHRCGGFRQLFLSLRTHIVRAIDQHF